MLRVHEPLQVHAPPGDRNVNNRFIAGLGTELYQVIVCSLVKYVPCYRCRVRHLNRTILFWVAAETNRAVTTITESITETVTETVK